MLGRPETAALYCVLLFASLQASAGRLQPELEAQLQAASPGDRLRVIVELEEQVRAAELAAVAPKVARRARARALVEALKDKARRHQAALKAELTREQSLRNVERVTPLWIVNGVALRATPAAIRRLAARNDVREIRLDAEIPPPPRPADAGASSAATEWNVALIRAPEVWALVPPYSGQGAVVGSFDTGVDATHQDLAASYRGNDAISWFDPYDEHTQPFDSNGHGTHTMGTAVGGSASGTAIGVAPGAKWIAAKAWNDSGLGLTSAFHQIFEWFLAPGGDPDNAPDVVNNSWAFVANGCNTEFVADIQAWRAAGIFPAFAAGNAGPGAGSVRSPGAYAEAFAVGATDVYDEVASFSSRGPSPCNGIIKPDVSAPGSAVRSAVPGDSYGTLSGTSMATPHVAGAVAVLRSIEPAMTVEDLVNALTLGAADVTEPGPDNQSGAGRLDLAVSAEIVLRGTDAPVVKVVATTATAYEVSGAAGVLTFSRSGNTDESLEVKYTVAGTATPASDYAALPETIVIPAGSSSVPLVIQPLDDALAEANETVLVTLSPDAAYIASWSRFGSVIIVSDELLPDLAVSGLSAPSSASAGQSITITETTRNQGGGPAQASITQYVLSSDAASDAADTMLAARSVPALAGGASSAGSTVVALPANVVGGTWYLIAVADAPAGVAETSETNNTAFRSIQIGPDLAASGLSAPSTASAGASLTLSETTRNQGAGPADASVTQYFLSANISLDAGDAAIGSRSVPALAAGANHAGSAVVTLPAGTATGLWYLIAKADAGGEIAETVETNNTTYRSVQIGPDLTVPTLSAPTSAGPGQSITVTDTTRNQGGGAAAESLTQIFFSSNATLDAGDNALGSRTIAALAGGASNAGQTLVTIPAGTSPGNWYLIAKADADVGVTETSETNNTILRTIQIGADLTVTGLTAPASAAAGQNLTVTETTRNQGAGPAEASITQVYLSSDITLDASDLLLAHRDIPPLPGGAISSGSTAVVIPAQTGTGTWYLIAKADAAQAVQESSETNNNATRTIKIGADLSVATVSAPASASAGASFSVTDTTRNLGGGPAEESVTQIFLSRSTTLDATDIALGSRSVPALAAGASNTGSAEVTIAADTPAGVWYLIAKADAGSVVPETAEGNNTALRAIQIGPDLVVSAFSVPTTASAGQGLTVTDTTRNQGAGPAQGSQTQFYLSTNSSLDASDALLGSRDVAELAAGASNAGSTGLSIPAGTAAGTWYLIAKTDAGATVPETSETNNTLSRSMQITAGTP